MKLKFKGFTLIELLIVVAIIAILAAIAVPNFLEAQIRSKVSKAKTDMRTMATGLEAYFVDQNTYVPTYVKVAANDTAGVFSVNSSLEYADPLKPNGGKDRITFQTHNPNNVAALGFSLTTPIAYLTSLSNDPFADTRGCVFGYWNAYDAGWLAWSYGPDTDENSETYPNGQIQTWLTPFAEAIVTAASTDDGGADDDIAKTDYLNESEYNPFLTNPTSQLVSGGFMSRVDEGAFQAYTYDATNGSTSIGDVWRVKQ